MRLYVQEGEYSNKPWAVMPEDSARVPYQFLCRASVAEDQMAVTPD